MANRRTPGGPIRWTTLGNAPYPKSDEPCSGYLLQAGGANVLVDIGGGVLGALQRYIRLEELHAVWISHLHADHFADMPLLYYAFAFAETPMRKIPVLGPVGWAARVEAFVKSSVDHHMSDYFQVVELTDRGIAEIGDLKVQARAVEHAVPAFGLTARYGDRLLAYTGDSGPCDNLVSLARGAHTLVAECFTKLVEIPSVHLSPEDAGLTASHASVTRLVLTHLGPGLGDDEAVDRAASVFGGIVEVAAPGMSFEV
ncbi:MAG: MBL fold metallo-hydrolase [Candidatus Limnocylindrales bacterium]